MQLEDTVKKLLHSDKGIFALDESNKTANSKRLEPLGIKATVESRRLFRQLFVDTMGMEKYVSGVILCDETILQKSDSRKFFIDILKVKGIIPGIKVDKGLKDLNSWCVFNKLFCKKTKEKVTQGIKGLDERLAEYKKMGLGFAKWRGVFNVSDTFPSDKCISKNVKVFTQYALLCQRHGIVPIIEPEVLYDSNHSIEQCELALEKVLKGLFDELKKQNVNLGGLIIKTSMVLAGKQNARQSEPKEVAEATLRVFNNSIPEKIGGIVFLSGGQSEQMVNANLSEIKKMGKHPWEITFSYARALQFPALKIWSGDSKKIKEARESFLEQLEKAVRARKGEY